MGLAPTQMGESLPFVDLGAGSEAVQLSCGVLHCCALLSGGSLKCWGSNSNVSSGWLVLCYRIA